MPLCSALWNSLNGGIRPLLRIWRCEPECKTWDSLRHPQMLCLPLCNQLLRCLLLRGSNSIRCLPMKAALACGSVLRGSHSAVSALHQLLASSSRSVTALAARQRFVTLLSYHGDHGTAHSSSTQPLMQHLPLSWTKCWSHRRFDCGVSGLLLHAKRPTDVMLSVAAATATEHPHFSPALVGACLHQFRCDIIIYIVKSMSDADLQVWSDAFVPNGSVSFLPVSSSR